MIRTIPANAHDSISKKEFISYQFSFFSFSLPPESLPFPPLEIPGHGISLHLECSVLTQPLLLLCIFILPLKLIAPSFFRDVSLLF